MKKFHFALSAVQHYKESLLENLKQEYAAILTEIANQEKRIAEREAEKDRLKEELNAKNSAGIAPFELGQYQRYIKVVQNIIEQEILKLKKLQKAENEKQDELIEMKKETASYEMLKERKLREYNFMANKAHEQFIEEFVSHRRHVAGR